MTLTTRHVFLGRVERSDRWEELAVAEGVTTDDQFFRVDADDWPAVRYLRIDTTDTESNVSWGEIEVHGVPSENDAAPVLDRTDGLPVDVVAVTASSAQLGAAAIDVIDGDVGAVNRWTAEGAAPQWIQLDLGAPTEFDEIALHSWDDPEGLVRFVIEVAGADRGFVEVTDRTVLLRTADRLSARVEGGFVDVQYVRITTLESDNTPSWAEIELLGRE